MELRLFASFRWPKLLSALTFGGNQRIRVRSTVVGTPYTLFNNSDIQAGHPTPAVLLLEVSFVGFNTAVYDWHRLNLLLFPDWMSEARPPMGSRFMLCLFHPQWYIFIWFSNSKRLSNGEGKGKHS